MVCHIRACFDVISLVLASSSASFDSFRPAVLVGDSKGPLFGYILIFTKLEKLECSLWVLFGSYSVRKVPLCIHFVFCIQKITYRAAFCFLRHRGIVLEFFDLPVHDWIPSWSLM